LGLERAFGNLFIGQDIEGILDSHTYLHTLMKSELKSGIPSERDMRVGFSQGGSISMLSGVTSPYKFGAVFGMLCFLLLSNDNLDYMPKESLDANKETPILLAHRDRDHIVNLDRERLAEEILGKDDWNAELKMYP
jgi:lysophospholipase-1